MTGEEEVPEGWPDDLPVELWRDMREKSDRREALWNEAREAAERRIKESKPRLEHAQALAIVQEEMASRGVPYPTVLAERFAEMTRRPILYPFTPAGRRIFTLRHGLPPRLRNPPQEPPDFLDD